MVLFLSLTRAQRRTWAVLRSACCGTTARGELCGRARPRPAVVLRVAAGQHRARRLGAGGGLPARGGLPAARPAPAAAPAEAALAPACCGVHDARPASPRRHRPCLPWRGRPRLVRPGRPATTAAGILVAMTCPASSARGRDSSTRCARSSRPAHPHEPPPPAPSVARPPRALSCSPPPSLTLGHQSPRAVEAASGPPRAVAGPRRGRHTTETGPRRGRRGRQIDASPASKPDGARRGQACWRVHLQRGENEMEGDGEEIGREKWLIY
ncbi:hypothetical protein PVAP13_5KG340921 [Panicum virgatum]|uniref:Uncharacterized protein n=1 Tax=Panicum virgatum TaxID=38727 RepID=A0A8T0SMT2_PANVG|nr:hypothetical protein PVAP13_5KG340921 [Panicum virgatum]